MESPPILPFPAMDFPSRYQSPSSATCNRYKSPIFKVPTPSIPTRRARANRGMHVGIAGPGRGLYANGGLRL